MARIHRERAFVRRRALIERLGGKCVDCGATQSLEIDHPKGRDYDVRKMDPSWRIAVYEREEREGVPQEVRCKSCNSSAHKIGNRSVRESVG